MTLKSFDVELNSLFINSYAPMGTKSERLWLKNNVLSCETDKVKS